MTNHIIACRPLGGFYIGGFCYLVEKSKTILCARCACGGMLGVAKSSCTPRGAIERRRWCKVMHSAAVFFFDICETLFVIWLLSATFDHFFLPRFCNFWLFLAPFFCYVWQFLVTVVHMFGHFCLFLATFSHFEPILARFWPLFLWPSFPVSFCLFYLWA